jgi:hypothetical protein
MSDITEGSKGPTGMPDDSDVPEMGTAQKLDPDALPLRLERSELGVERAMARR